MVEAEIFAADGTALIGAWNFSLVEGVFTVREDLLAYRSILEFLLGKLLLR